MGTTFRVRAVLPEEALAEEVGQRITDCLASVNQAMSTFLSDSEISRFNDSTETGKWFPVSPEFAQVVTYSLELAAESGGAFDPTIGPVVDLWGFGSGGFGPGGFGTEGPKFHPPTDKQLAAARQGVGFQKVEARLDPPAIQKSVGGVRLNLSAVAKGYGVDAVGEQLTRAGCAAYMVEIGGEVRTRGHKPNGQSWKIGIEQADPNRKGYRRIVALSDQAMATSGDYRNFFEHEGKRFSHSIDPMTGRPVEHSLATVTVRAPTCMEADALATAILVLGPDRGFAWAEKREIAALLVDRQGDDFHEQATEAWKSPIAETKSSSSEKTWQTFVVAGLLFALAMAGMAIGVIVAGRRLQGSCGGLANLHDGEGKTACELCKNPSPDCTGNPDRP